jgi:hypothetical protein
MTDADPDLDIRETLNNVTIEMLVTVGLMGSVMYRYPQHVQENFREKIVELTANIREVTTEFVDFGEAYDDNLGE